MLKEFLFAILDGKFLHRNNVQDFEENQTITLKLP
jgi:hypothetical protein